MLTPRTIYEQIKNTPFEADEKILVVFSTSEFDQAVDNEQEQGFEDVPEAEASAKEMMEAMKLYGITDDQNVYNLANPSGKVC